MKHLANAARKFGLVSRLLDALLGPRCSRPGCERRASGFALREVRCSGKTIEVRSAPEPMCSEHLKEFTEQEDEEATQD